MKIMGGNKGQAHPIYSLASRYQPFNFRRNVASNGLLVEEWLKVVKDVMRIYTMIDMNKIQYANLILEDDFKAWWQMLYRTYQVSKMTRLTLDGLLKKSTYL